MAEVLVLALGNSLRGDDGLAWHAARRLETSAAGKSLEVVACRQLTPELAELVAEAQRVIFVDAAVNVPPGEVRWEAVHAGTGGRGGFSHQLKPAALLGYTKSLFGAHPEAFQVSVGGKSFDYWEGLSPEAQARLPELVRVIEELCLRSTPSFPPRTESTAAASRR